MKVLGLRYLCWSLPISTQLEGLEEVLVPIGPISTCYKIKVYTKEGNAFQCTIKRSQLPVIEAYTFTDYCSQGQTKRHAVVDLAWPPTGTLSLFNLYVALSHTAGMLGDIRFACCEILMSEYSNEDVINS